MRSTDEEVVKKIKEEIISLYETVISIIWNKFKAKMGEDEAMKLFNEMVKDFKHLSLYQTKEGRMTFKGLKKMEKEKIIFCCNEFISSLMSKVVERKEADRR